MHNIPFSSLWPSDPMNLKLHCRFLGPHIEQVSHTTSLFTQIIQTSVPISEKTSHKTLPIHTQWKSRCVPSAWTWKIGFYRLYLDDISRRPRNEIQHRLSLERKTGKIGDISTYRKWRWRRSSRRRISKNHRKITDISVFLPIFRKFPVQSTHRIQNLSNFLFLFLNKMLFGNLIMICRQRLCFSTWLKNCGFRVGEI